MVWGRLVLWMLRVICGVRHQIENEHNVPTGPFIIVSNHQSPWETFFLYFHFVPVCVILKKELMNIPFFGWGMRLLHPIAIDRSKPRDARNRVLTEGRKRLEEGLSILIFPEGTRLNPGERKKFSVGAAELAVATNATVLPVVHNAGHYWPGKKLVKHPGTIRLIVGEPIDATGRNIRELRQELQEWIYNTLDEITPDTPE